MYGSMDRKSAKIRCELPACYAMVHFRSMTFWAHSDRAGLSWDTPGSSWQPLAGHLRDVAKLARSLAECAAPQYKHFHELAERCGLLHDYGKYSDCFQRMITTGEGRCPHAIHGAVMAFHALGSPHIAAAIAGHHAGIPDLGECRDRINKSQDEAERLRDRAVVDSSEIAKLLSEPAPIIENMGRKFELLTRMLLSCLVDADRLDTAGRVVLQAPLDAEQRLRVLLAHIDQLGTSDGVVNATRREVLSDCLNAASLQERILSLSVPTGGGKTLSAMAFALRRAAMEPDRYRRIIIVIPYLSIIEQNADVYARVFGSDSILEHHSGSFVRLKVADEQHFAVQTDESERYEQMFQRPETENWDAPLIVTTSVRFFESLFSNHPSDVRRIHNIARSIVILDEVQVLPRHLLGPLLGMIDELAEDWGCSFVLSTATKPAFERPASDGTADLRWKAGKIREIVQAPAELHNRLRRVHGELQFEAEIKCFEGFDSIPGCVMWSLFSFI
ncbi:MAG: cas3 [Bryobacterales bacterium]|nr:cas3 [Bryobacterales bacterium]